MAPHTEEYLQDLRARYIGVNKILFLRGPQPEFEDLTFDLGKISPLLSEVRSNLGKLLETVRDQSDDISMGDVATWDRILAEGTNNHEHGNSEGVAEMMADAMLCHNQPLTKQTLCDWHYRMFFFDETRFSVFPIGEYRGIEEGPIYFQDTGFVCTEPERIEEETDKFLAWFNGESSKQIDPFLRVAISSLWFQLPGLVSGVPRSSHQKQKRATEVLKKVFRPPTTASKNESSISRFECSTLIKGK